VDFIYTNRQVRTVEQNNLLWFVAKDVCEILGIDNVSKAVSLLDEDKKIRVLFLPSRQTKFAYS
jgi:prophage antirepressor-like protein